MRKFWFSDFEFENGAFLVKKTGHYVPLNLNLVSDIAVWMSFFTLAQGWRVWHSLRGHRRPRVHFVPDVPRPWYFIWPVLQASGAIIEKDPSKADVVFHFDDATHSEGRLPEGINPNAKLINFDCRDVSKTLVAEAWEHVAGYSLAVDPRSFDGPMVEKSEVNAAHDGRIIEGPIEPIEGKTYQRLIDNRVKGGMVEDLRTTFVNGEPTLVFIKRRPQARRFLNENSKVSHLLARNCFTVDELDVIRRFAREIGLDWGGVDVLRDATSGKIYIVDANKTDMGPPIAMPLGQKLRSTRLTARAFSAAYAPKIRG